MNNILMELSGMRRLDAAEREKALPFAEIMRMANSAPEVRNFAAAFARPVYGDAAPCRVIAELKKASPSEGMIRAAFDPEALARELTGAGAAALSVLCEPHRFLGSEDYLRTARQVTDLPILYKDFLTTRYQIAAARAAGADAVLLIAAVLDDATLADLLGFTRSLGMEALVETHDRHEIDRAVDAGAGVVGVNCRDLRNFTTDVSLLEQLAGAIPETCVRIAESGMHTREAIMRAKAAGADGFLVGTALMRAPSPSAKLKQLTRLR